MNSRLRVPGSSRPVISSTSNSRTGSDKGTRFIGWRYSLTESLTRHRCQSVTSSSTTSTVREILTQCSELLMIRSRPVFQEQSKVVATLVFQGLRDQAPTTTFRNLPSASERNTTQLLHNLSLRRHVSVSDDYRF